MAQTKLKDGVKDEVPSLHGRAMENLEFIREAMQRSSEFTAVPGYGGMLMGVTALGAAAIASLQTDSRYWLATWLVEAALAFLIGLLAMWQKSRSSQSGLNTLPAKKFALGFVPPVAAGVILTLLLAFNGQLALLPTVWITLYGVAVVTGGSYSVRPVPVMGWLFIVAGAGSVLAPSGSGDVLMAGTFGVVHIIFGAIIGRNYGG